MPTCLACIIEYEEECPGCDNKSILSGTVLPDDYDVNAPRKYSGPKDNFPVDDGEPTKVGYAFESLRNVGEDPEYGDTSRGSTVTRNVIDDLHDSLVEDGEGETKFEKSKEILESLDETPHKEDFSRGGTSTKRFYEKVAKKTRKDIDD